MSAALAPTIERQTNSSWDVEVDRVSPAAWSQMLCDFDDANFFQTFSYGRVRWGAQNLSHLVLKKDGIVRGLAQVRILRPTPLKFGMAYLRWGPLWARRGFPLDAESAARIVQAVENEYVHNRGLFLRVLPHAFAGSGRAALLAPAFQHFSTEPVLADNLYRTFIVDLCPPVEQFRKNLDRKWRGQLNGAERNNLNFIATEGPGEFSRLLAMYKEMRERKGFASGVDPQEYELIQNDLPEPQRLRVFLCEHSGEIVSGIALCMLGDTALALIAASTEMGRQLKSTFFLQWNLTQWLKQCGIRWYDLGGINPRTHPTIYRFKRGLPGADSSHMGAFVASKGPVSAALVKVGLAVRRAINAV